MGDRVLVQFVDHDDISPVIYLHWGGETVGQLLGQCQTLMVDRNDVAYVAARFVGICHDATPGNLSVGMWNTDHMQISADSHGDAGVVVVDVSKLPWQVECLGGYLDAADVHLQLDAAKELTS